MTQRFEFWFNRPGNDGSGRDLNQELHHVDDNGEIIKPRIVSLYGYGSQQMYLSPGHYRMITYVIGTNGSTSYDFVVKDDGTSEDIDNATDD